MRLSATPPLPQALDAAVEDALAELAIELGWDTLPTDRTRWIEAARLEAVEDGMPR